jgi:AcrR family transcriptional regulator
MDGTASLAGLSKGTLYLHYTSPALQWMERLMQLALEFYALTGHDREMRQFFYQ